MHVVRRIELDAASIYAPKEGLQIAVKAQTHFRTLVTCKAGMRSANEFSLDSEFCSVSGYGRAGFYQLIG